MFFEKSLSTFTFFFYQGLQPQDTSELIHRRRQILDIQ